MKFSAFLVQRVIL